MFNININTDSLDDVEESLDTVRKLYRDKFKHLAEENVWEYTVDHDRFAINFCLNDIDPEDTFTVQHNDQTLEYDIDYDELVYTVPVKFTETMDLHTMLTLTLIRLSLEQAENLEDTIRMYRILLQQYIHEQELDQSIPNFNYVCDLFEYEPKRGPRFLQHILDCFEKPPDCKE